MAKVKQETEKQEQPLEKKTTKQQEVVEEKEQPTENKVLQYVHIDTFLATAQVLYAMSGIQVQGFKAYMVGNHYQKGDEAFVPYLKKYLGIGD